MAIVDYWRRDDELVAGRSTRRRRHLRYVLTSCATGRWQLVSRVVGVRPSWPVWPGGCCFRLAHYATAARHYALAADLARISTTRPTPRT